MESLNDSQLELEALKIEEKSLPAFLHLENMKTYLTTMEGYLRKILNEYEKKSPGLKNNLAVIFTELEHHDEFTGSSHRDFAFSQDKKEKDKNINSPFKQDFSRYYAEAIKEIGRIISGENNVNNI